MGSPVSLSVRIDEEMSFDATSMSPSASTRSSSFGGSQFEMDKVDSKRTYTLEDCHIINDSWSVSSEDVGNNPGGRNRVKRLKLFCAYTDIRVVSPSKGIYSRPESTQLLRGITVRVSDDFG